MPKEIGNQKRRVTTKELEFEEQDELRKLNLMKMKSKDKEDRLQDMGIRERKKKVVDELEKKSKGIFVILRESCIRRRSIEE